MSRKRKTTVSHARDRMINIQKIFNKNKDMILHCWLTKKDNHAKLLWDSEAYFLFDFYYHHCITVCVDPQEVNELVNDYHIRKNKSIFRLAGELILSGLNDYEKGLCTYIIRKYPINSISKLEENAQDFDHLIQNLARDISCTLLEGNDEEIILRILYKIFSMEQEIYKGRKSFPINLNSGIHKFDVKKKASQHPVDVVFTLSYQPYRNNQENPTPWRMYAYTKTTYLQTYFSTDEDDFGEICESTEQEEIFKAEVQSERCDLDIPGGIRYCRTVPVKTVESSKISVDLTSIEMDSLIQKLIFFLKELGYQQPEQYTFEFFPISDEPSIKRLNRHEKRDI